MLLGGDVDGGASGASAISAGTASDFSWAKALAVLGWDPHEALCFSCGKARPVYFYVPRQEFFCADCVKKLPLKLRGNAVLSIYAL
jgi:recombinational DNA repair protein (RecF pathway)